MVARVAAASAGTARAPPSQARRRALRVTLLHWQTTAVSGSAPEDAYPPAEPISRASRSLGTGWSRAYSRPTAATACGNPATIPDRIRPSRSRSRAWRPPAGSDSDTVSSPGAGSRSGSPPGPTTVRSNPRIPGRSTRRVGRYAVSEPVRMPARASACSHADARESPAAPACSAQSPMAWIRGSPVRSRSSTTIPRRTSRPAARAAPVSGTLPAHASTVAAASGRPSSSTALPCSAPPPGGRVPRPRRPSPGSAPVPRSPARRGRGGRAAARSAPT